MKDKKYILFSLNDEKAKVLGDVISNPTSKKIVEFIAGSDKKVSEGDIVKELGLPANTVNYQMKRLIEAGLIEKTKAFFLSSRGKKIQTYRVAYKLIVISPRNNKSVVSKLKGLLPAVLVSGVFSFLIGVYFKMQTVSNLASSGASEKFVARADEAIIKTVPEVPRIVFGNGDIFGVPQVSVWFFVGAMLALGFYSFWNWERL